MRKNGKQPSESVAKKSEEVVDRIVSEVKDKGKVLLNEGWEGARQVFDENVDAIKQKADELSDKTVDEITEDAKYFVRRNPLQSLGIAFGLGVIFGFIFKD